MPERKHITIVFRLSPPEQLFIEVHDKRTEPNPDMPETFCVDFKRLPHFVPALDGLRGVAVSMVFLFHADVPGFIGGFIGVDMFFVLSGFLISMILLQELSDSGAIDFKRFYLRRLLRLQPAFLTMLFSFLVFCMFRFPVKEELMRQIHEILIAMSYTANWTRAAGLGVPLILGHTWSLAVEEQYYLIWPISLAFLYKMPAHWRSGTIGLLLLASWMTRLLLLQHGASWDRLYNALDCRIDMLLAGSLLASLWHSGALSLAVRRCWLTIMGAVAGAVLICVLTYTGNWQTPALYQWQYELVALATCALILEFVSRPSGHLSALFRFPGLTGLGKISYGVYLWHYPIIAFMREIPFGHTYQVWCALLLTCACATISWYVVERPFLRLKQNFQPKAAAMQSL